MWGGKGGCSGDNWGWKKPVLGVVHMQDIVQVMSYPRNLYNFVNGVSQQKEKNIDLKNEINVTSWKLTSLYAIFTYDLCFDH